MTSCDYAAWTCPACGARIEGEYVVDESFIPRVQAHKRDCRDSSRKFQINPGPLQVTPDRVQEDYDAGRCKAVTQKGWRCSFNAVPGSDYCGRHSEAEREGGQGWSFKVCAERCDHCLFGRAPLVSEARRRQIVRDLQRRDTHFICHKFGFGEDADHLQGADVCCRGDYDRNPARTNLMRIAGRLGAVEFVSLPSYTERD